MEKVISLPFNYLDQEFYSIVRVSKYSSDSFKLWITVMNVDLEATLFGNNIIIVKNGQLEVDVPSASRKVAMLKLQIAKALTNYFQFHPLVVM